MKCSQGMAEWYKVKLCAIELWDRVVLSCSARFGSGKEMKRLARQG